MGTTTGGLALRWPDLASTAKGPEATRFLAEDVEAVYLEKALTSYTPVWSTAGTGAVQPTLPSQIVGAYRVQNGWCDLSVYIKFGASTTGGAMPMSVSLPVAGSSVLGEQHIEAKYGNTTYGNFLGRGKIVAGASIVNLLMPKSLTQNWLYPMQHADATLVSPNTGVPLMSSVAVVGNGGDIAIHGRYLV